MKKRAILEELKATIAEEVEHVGVLHYSHNIISLCLKEIAKCYGVAAANDVIREFELEKYGWKKR